MDFINQFAKNALKQLNEAKKQMTKLLNDFDSFEIEKQMTDTWSELKQIVKNLTDKFIVSVPFDREKEKLSFSIENGMIIVQVTSNSDDVQFKSVTETKIPTGIDVNRMIQKYDEKHKKMLFIFLKKIPSAVVEKDKPSKGDMIKKMIKLHNEEIIEKSDCAKQQAQENEHLLNSFISAKKIEGCSDKTLAYYRNTIERLLVTLSLAICHISTTDIRTYLSDYQEEHQSSKVTIDNMRRIFSSFFAWLEDEDYIAKSPVRRIHKVKTDSLVKEVLSDEQLEQLRDCCTNKRDLAIIDILASTGIRVGELVKLNREDIDFHERQCVVFGKGNKERVVYFNARTKLHLQQYLNERTDDNPALFVSLNSPHSRLTISGVEVRIRKLGQSLSMPKVHPHKFRRTLATMAIDKGMPIEQVQRLLCHVLIDTTLHYAIVNQNNVKLAHKKYLG